MKLFILTLRFLTRIPVPFYEDTILSSEEFSKGIVYYPLIGLILGCCNSLVFFLFAHLGFGLLGAVSAVFVEILLTGAFHLDGLADTCDALFSSRNKERMLEIMRDSRVGTNGVVAIVFDILLKIILISSLEGRIIWVYLLLAPVAGKMITPFLMHSVYARKEAGLGSIYLRETYSGVMLFSMSTGIIFMGIGFGFASVFPILITFFGAYLFRCYCNNKIGGMTGDTLGAGCEIGEILFLLAVLLQGRYLA